MSLRKRFRRALRAWRGEQPRATAYAGAQINRLTQDWILAAIRSADDEVRGDQTTLRKRSRELARNNPHGHRFLELLEDNVIGPRGIRLQSKVTNDDGTLDRDTNDRIETAWKEWGKKSICTVDGRLGWTDVLGLMVTTWAQDGEALLRIVPGFRNRFGFAVQLLDPDQLDLEYNRPVGTSPSGGRRNEIRMGVEIDEWGRPVNYHVWSSHPTEVFGMGRGRERVVIPASQIVHLYRHSRVGQTRGVPRFAPILIYARMLAGLEEAELVASRVAAAKGGFFSRDPEALGGAETDTHDEETLPTEAEPGTYDVLPPGWTFHARDPQHPNSAFEPFHKSMLRAIASGVGSSYHVLANDLTDVNFSSMRAGTLAERDVWRRVQRWIVEHVIEAVFDQWFLWARTAGALELMPQNRERWHERMWMARGWPWVDPEKDLNAARQAILLGLNTRTRIAAENGLDFEELLQELAEEERMARELGVSISGEPPEDEDEDNGDGAGAVKPRREVLAALNGSNGNGHGPR